VCIALKCQFVSNFPSQNRLDIALFNSVEIQAGYFCTFYVVDGKAPAIIDGLKDTAAEAKKDVTLKCKVDPGKPKATAEW